MAIVQNANEEHQFVFAVNAISMVKSDALFTYVAPTNVIAWILAPLRFVIPFQQFVRLNRTMIKATHFPILFTIYAYERLILVGTLFEPTDLVEQRGRPRSEIKAFETPGVGLKLFSPKMNRLREPSVATFHKDRALEEVFRRPFRDNTVRNTQKSHDRRKTSNVVNHWMSNMGPNGTASPPVEQDRSIVDRLEARRAAHRRSLSTMRPREVRGRRDFTQATTMSIVSDPEEFQTNVSLRPPPTFSRDTSGLTATNTDGVIQTDADGDDELATNEEEDLITLDRRAEPSPSLSRGLPRKDAVHDYFHLSPSKKPQIPHFDSSYTVIKSKTPPTKQIAAVRVTPPKTTRHHNRNPFHNHNSIRPPSST